MTTAPAMSCPGDEELERAVLAGGGETRVRAHVEGCAACRERREQIRENLAFMRGVIGDLGEESGAPSSRAVLEPDVLPGYRLVREIARGGQGVVYEALQLDTKRRVAVKLVEPGAAGGHGRRRIEREAELAASLRHANIVGIYQSTPLGDGRHALAMEYVDGETMDEWARGVDAAAAAAGGGREALRQAVRTKLRAVAAVCDALQHAHVNGVIHRDLKPANVLVTAAGTPRVVDFGVARRVVAETRITRPGGFAGTLAYASPEQVSGGPDAVDTRSDVYALGLLLYETLTSRRPYETDGSLSGAIAAITRGGRAPLSTVEPGGQPAGDELEAIVAKALAPDREERYQSAAAMRDDLESLLAGRAVEARRQSTGYVLRKLASRHRPAVAAGAALLVLLAAFAGSMAWSSGRLSRQRTLLASALASSMIERGRLAGLGGESARAEELIWPELIRAGGNPADPTLPFASTPEAMQPAWALIELYSRHPCLMHTPVLPGAAGVRFEGSAGPDGAVRVVRSDGAQEVRDAADGRLLGSTGAIFEVSPARVLLDRTRRRALLVDPAGGFRVLDLDTGASRRVDGPGMSGEMELDLSPDGSRFVTASGSGILTLWGTEPTTVIAWLGGPMGPHARARFSADGTYLVAGIGDEVRRWRALDGRPAGVWKVPPALWGSAMRAAITGVQLSPDGLGLAAAMHTQLLLFSTERPEEPPRTISAHRGFVGGVEYSADSSLVMTSGNERMLKTWDARTGAPLVAVEDGRGARGSPALSADGARMAACDRGDAVRVFETRPRRWLTRRAVAGNTVNAARFSPDGALVAAVAADGGAEVWRRSDGGTVWAMPPGGRGLEALAFAPDGGRLAMAGDDGRIGVIDLRAMGEGAEGPGGGTAGDATPETFARCAMRVTWIGFSPDGRTLAATGIGPTIELFDGATGAATGRLTGHAGRVVQAAFGRDGRTLVSVGTDGVAISWDLGTLEARFRTPAVGAKTRAVAVSPDGAVFVTGSDDWKIRTWDARTGRLLGTVAGVKQDVFGLAFHPLGNVLFSCGRESVVQVWDVRTGRELAVLDGHEGLVMSVEVSPDGGSLATASVDKTVGAWDLGYYRKHLVGNAGMWKPSGGVGGR